METWFEWDEAKAASNLRKHGVSFENATRAFFDPFIVTEQDRIEDGEYRWQIFGLVGDVLLQVAHTVRENEDEDDLAVEVIRIISARHADPKERRRYEQNRSLLA